MNINYFIFLKKMKSGKLFFFYMKYFKNDVENGTKNFVVKILG